MLSADRAPAPSALVNWFRDERPALHDQRLDIAWKIVKLVAG